ncbi:MAG: hypothetical protein HON04_12315 [Planctomicrobium sp.]|nr:hypothetical protein [Planctomicrobium sp.]
MEAICSPRERKPTPTGLILHATKMLLKFWSLRVNPGMAIRVPLAWEIELLVASLQSILSFLNQSEPTHTFTTTTATGEITLKLTRLPG